MTIDKTKLVLDISEAITNLEELNAMACRGETIGYEEHRAALQRLEDLKARAEEHTEPSDFDGRHVIDDANEPVD